MQKLVVRSVEELKAARCGRHCPTIFIEGELANDLLISGLIETDATARSGKARVVCQAPHSTPMRSVAQALTELSIANDFEVMKGQSGTKIRIYPKPCMRREGN